MFWYYIFPFIIFQGGETTTWLTPGCSQRRQTHWGMEVGFDGFDVSCTQAPAVEHSPSFPTLIHKYFLSLMYSLSSNQFVLLWNNEWSDFSLACALRQPHAMQGFHQLHLFPLYGLFEKPVWSVFFLFCITVSLNKHPVSCKSAALSYSMKYSLIFPPTFRICEQCCDQHRYSKLFLLQHHLILYFVFCLTLHWK